MTAAHTDETRQMLKWSNPDQLSEHYVCEICCQLFTQYVQCNQCANAICVRCYHSLERSRCPSCSFPMVDEPVLCLPRSLLKNLNEQLVDCLQCNRTMTYSQFKKHRVLSCWIHCSTRCMNGGVDGHEDGCVLKQLPCSAQPYGCEFEGSAQALKEHQNAHCEYLEFERSYLEAQRRSLRMFGVGLMNSANVGQLVVVVDVSTKHRSVGQLVQVFQTYAVLTIMEIETVSDLVYLVPILQPRKLRSPELLPLPSAKSLL